MIADGPPNPRPRMSQPATRFVTTSDGVKIAYLRVGSGPPVVFASNFRGDVHNYRGLAAARNQTRAQHAASPKNPTDRLAALGWEVIQHDGRGMGSSDRDVADWSLDGRIKDLEAVLSRVDSERVILAGADQGTPAAIAYAARNPARVSHLVLICPFATGEGRYALPALQLAMAGASTAAPVWSLFTNVVGSVVTQF